MNSLGFTSRCLGWPGRAPSGCVDASRGSHVAVRIGCGSTGAGDVRTREGTGCRLEPESGLHGELEEWSAEMMKSARGAAGVIHLGGRGPFQLDFKGARTLLRADDAGVAFRGDVEVGRLGCRSGGTGTGEVEEALGECDGAGLGCAPVPWSWLISCSVSESSSQKRPRRGGAGHWPTSSLRSFIRRRSGRQVRSFAVTELSLFWIDSASRIDIFHG
jgi:hypothetical protein